MMTSRFKKVFRTIPLLALLACCLVVRATAQTTAFTYQGILNDGNNAANGRYDMQFAVYDSINGGNQTGGTETLMAVNVTNGYFSLVLDFGSQFPGANRWIEISVRTNGFNHFTKLTPRQVVTSSPYAITAGSLNGQVTYAQLPPTVLTNGQTNVVLNGTFNGASVNGTIAATNFPTSSPANIGLASPNSITAIGNSLYRRPYTAPAMVINSWADGGNDQGTEYDFYRYPDGSSGFIGSVNRLAASGLIGLGWDTICIDGGWYGYRDSNGFLHENAQAWPDGISNCVRYAHSLGIKVGIWHSCNQLFTNGLARGFASQDTWWLSHTNLFNGIGKQNSDDGNALNTNYFFTTNVPPSSTNQVLGPAYDGAIANHVNSPVGLSVSYNIGADNSTQTFIFDTSADNISWATNAISMKFTGNASRTYFSNSISQSYSSTSRYIRLNSIINSSSSYPITNLLVSGFWYIWFGNTNVNQLNGTGFSNDTLVKNDATWFAKMGIDYVKLETGTNLNWTDAQEAAAYRLFYNTMASNGVQPYLMSAGIGEDPAMGIQPWSIGLTSARRSGQFDMPNASWGTFCWSKFMDNFFWAAMHPEVTGPGNYVSTDIIPDNFNATQQGAMLLMQAMMCSELSVEDSQGCPAMYNTQIIALDKDPAARMAVCIYTNGTPYTVNNVPEIDGLTVWKKPLYSASGDTFALMILNNGASTNSFTVTNLASIGSQYALMNALDILSNVSFNVSNNWTITVPPYMAYGYKLTPISATNTVYGPNIVGDLSFSSLTNALSKVGLISGNTTNSIAGLTITGAGTQVTFGSASTPPANTNPVAWISVNILGDTNQYRLPLMK